MIFKENFLKKESRERAFSLIETFIAITILVMAITGPITLISQSLSSAKTVKGRVTSIYLAQEVFEYVRNVRDCNILDGLGWLDGLDPCLISGQKCKIDSPAQSIDACSLSGCEYLKYNPISYLYNYDSGDTSLFKREIEITEIKPGKEIKISVDVFWNEGPRLNQFSVESYLLNWQ